LKVKRELRSVREVLPTLSTGKTRITILLDDAVVQAYKTRAVGRGYCGLSYQCLTMHTNMHTIRRMEFTCNAIKNEKNVRERGLPLLAARAMFNDDMLVREDTRQVYSERRFIGYAALAGRLMVVVFCRPSEERIHIISFRKANGREQNKFEIKPL